VTALLEVDHVTKQFPVGGLLSRRYMNAVDEVSFVIEVEKPEIFTIIGESGSGKTTLARMILGLEHPTRGAIRFQGKTVTSRLSRADRLRFMAAVQPVFQNPFEAFNPLKQVDRYLASTARTFVDAGNKKAVDAAMDVALQKVGLSLAEVRGRFPHELSGGQLQRVAIARALIPNPPLLITDEPVSMVDASLRMSIVNLLKSLRDDFGVSIIYITHDLATAYYVSDRIIIMQRGKVVEMGPARTVLDAPEHPYSRLLKASVLSAEDAGHGKLGAAIETADALRMESTGELVARPDGRLVRFADTAAVR
jgi:peptide/nickel transport system ATP-binding protein